MRSLALLVLFSSVAPPALALDAEPEACTSDVTLDVWVDEQLTPRCEAVFGGLEQRDANEAWLDQRNVQVSDRGRLVDILHSDARFKRPVRRALPGMTMLEVRPAMVAEEDCTEEVDDDEPEVTTPAEEGGGGTDDAKADPPPAADEDDAEDEEDTHEEMVAIVQLSDAWQQVCGTERVIVRVGDSLGAGGRVVWIGRRGMLTHIGGRLAWVPRVGARDPEFRLTWRAGFAISMDKPTAGKKKKPARKRRNRKKKRRR